MCQACISCKSLVMENKFTEITIIKCYLWNKSSIYKILWWNKGEFHMWGDTQPRYWMDEQEASCKERGKKSTPENSAKPCFLEDHKLSGWAWRSGSLVEIICPQGIFGIFGCYNLGEVCYEHLLGRGLGYC